MHAYSKCWHWRKYGLIMPSNGFSIEFSDSVRVNARISLHSLKITEAEARRAEASVIFKGCRLIRALTHLKPRHNNHSLNCLL